MMTETQQSQRVWFSSWREHRRAKHQQLIERERFAHERAGEPGGIFRRSSAYQQSGPVRYWTGFGGDGDGDGGGGGC